MIFHPRTGGLKINDVLVHTLRGDTVHSLAAEHADTGGLPNRAQSAGPGSILRCL